MAKPIISNDEYPLSTNLGMQALQALEKGDAAHARELSAQSHVTLRDEDDARSRRRRAVLDKIADEREQRGKRRDDHEHER